MKARSSVGAAIVLLAAAVGVGFGVAANASSMTLVAECPECDGIQGDGQGLVGPPTLDVNFPPE